MSIGPNKVAAEMKDGDAEIQFAGPIHRRTDLPVKQRAQQQHQTQHSGQMPAPEWDGSARRNVPIKRGGRSFGPVDPPSPRAS